MAEHLPRRALLTLPLLGAAGCIPMTVRRETELVGQLDREVIALTLENERLRGQLVTCDGREQPPPAIFRELKQIFPTDDDQLRREGRTVVLTLSVSQLFTGGMPRVRREAAATLDLLSTALKLHPQHPVQVVGHSDDTPVTGGTRRYAPTNWELSCLRASALVRSLITDWGLAPERLTAAGRGEVQPIADNSTAEGRERNRRIEIHILPGGSP